eukprot:604417-Prymnesium_polylepis.1
MHLDASSPHTHEAENRTRWQRSTPAPSLSSLQTAPTPLPRSRGVILLCSSSTAPHARAAAREPSPTIHRQLGRMPTSHTSSAPHDALLPCEREAVPSQAAGYAVRVQTSGPSPEAAPPRARHAARTTRRLRARQLALQPQART